MAIIKHPEQRVGVFIDTQNLYHSAKNIYHARVNFGNVLKDAVGDRRLDHLARRSRTCLGCGQLPLHGSRRATQPASFRTYSVKREPGCDIDCARNKSDQRHIA